MRDGAIVIAWRSTPSPSPNRLRVGVVVDAIIDDDGAGRLLLCRRRTDARGYGTPIA